MNYDYEIYSELNNISQYLSSISKSLEKIAESTEKYEEGTEDDPYYYDNYDDICEGLDVDISDMKQ